MQISKWGNSLALRLPASIVEALGLKEGDDIEITIAGARRFVVAKDKARDKALEKLRTMKAPLPKGFRFDRDDANER
jgi:antitoxin MazE